MLQDICKLQKQEEINPTTGKAKLRLACIVEKTCLQLREDAYLAFLQPAPIPSRLAATQEQGKIYRPVPRQLLSH
jgi:hypothetical protein